MGLSVRLTNLSLLRFAQVIALPLSRSGETIQWPGYSAKCIKIIPSRVRTFALIPSLFCGRAISSSINAFIDFGNHIFVGTRNSLYNKDLQKVVLAPRGIEPLF